MGSRRVADQDIERYFDARAGCCAPERLGWRPIDRPTRALEKELVAHGVGGMSVLEVGCGTGELVRDLLGAGASRATGLDISPSSIARARGAAEKDGLAARLRFVAANGATARLEPHDILVHDKVICCYPDAAQFLANTLPAARDAYAFSMPRTDGVWRVLTRTWIGLENALHRIRRRGFRAHTHNARTVHEIIEHAGFALRRRRVTGGWLIAVYSRGSPGTSLPR
jgi:magnesium-protoporphyrin O-methyltransferase